MKKVLFVLILSVLLVGCAEEETIDIEGEALNYEELQAKKQETDQELDSVKKELFDAKAELGEVKEKITGEEKRFAGLEELADNREQLESEVAEAESEIESLQNEKEKLKEEIVEIKDEPITVNAGYFYFGEDIEPGRYQVKPQGNSSGNFFVRGTKRVNIILGSNRDSHLKEYTFEAFDGDELETGIPIELYPVE